ncbi:MULTISPECIES: TetR/AcrR family transcriptional regulator [unclassified Pseudomonas]|jgi:AcrR family transcriptional regulator|uniref:TetR/AcrR family transcriptional regulator n=1 Tax=unclassified Pseudomonas TaxID=196821 RepID=UPI000EAA30A1|nr:MULTISPECIES: TetR/AcrR family transcriptional regulator [unclassified Pseudomonas]AYF86459.1 TetR/AcrR family transcriptional regulator [Pseudomonas sp. DY-1]MRK23794.1 helix-turn-helix transcriptional regulator [Pseudomonas sp. JG-B]
MLDATTTRPSRYLENRHLALALFAEQGYGQVSMRDLAAQLGIKAGSIYYHVESKEALLFEFIEELYEQLLDNAALATRRHRDPAACLAALIDAHLALHQPMGLHFRLAELEARCLSGERLEQARTLRQAYEAALLEPLQQLAGHPLDAAGRGAVASIVSLLNQLPAWLDASGLPAEQGLELMKRMVLGSVHGAMRLP